MDGEAWWATVHGVAKSRTQLSDLTNWRIWASRVALVVQNPCANAGDARDLGLIPGSGRSPGEGNGNPLQYYCLENSMDRGPWRAVVYRDTTGDTRLTACIGVVLDFHIYKHTWEVGISGSVPDHHNKENTEIKHITLQAYSSGASPLSVLV